MLNRKFICLLLMMVTVTAFSQKNFSFSPEKPKPGDVITFTYEPGGDIANTILPVEALLYHLGTKGSWAEDIVLERIAGKYSGKVITDTGSNFMFLVFSSDKKFDNNFGNGYTFHVYEKDAVRKGSYANESLFYQGMGRFYANVDPNYTKAVEAMEKEFQFYPENRKKYLVTYLRNVSQAKKDNAPALIQKEIESLLKTGLKEEDDYTTVISLYNLAKLPEQAKFFTGVRNEKYPNGKATVLETVQKFYSEADLEKKKELLAKIIQNVESGNENWKTYEKSLPSLKLQLAVAYAHAKKWDEFKKTAEESGATKDELASVYNNLAWDMQKKGENLALAEEISRFATEYAKEVWKNPPGVKPFAATMLGTKQWKEQNGYTYAMYADTYGMILYRKGDYKKGLPYAKDAALLINKGKSADENNTYALLAEKVLPAKQYKKELEQFVKDGKSTSEMTEILKRTYVKEHKSEAGFDDYIAGLQKENYLKMVDELKKAMLNEVAPSFALTDLNGNKVNISDLKGKTVVVDFWATWCGPCKASFPAMQKMVSKFKENPDVKFVFIDTWERTDEKEKNAAQFIADNKYSFHVLMDNDSKVVEQFKVEGIPTKFVIDKNGVIRFRSIGFDGSDDKLVSELTAMIDIASGNMQKAF